MFFKKRNKQAEEISEPIIDKSENELKQTDNEPKSISKIISGKLYDTSRATHICYLHLWWEKIPGYNSTVYHIFGEDADLYKGNAEYFLAVHGDIKPVTEEWVKDILGQYNTEKYIELFGEPELA